MKEPWIYLRRHQRNTFPARLSLPFVAVVAAVAETGVSLLKCLFPCAVLLRLFVFAWSDEC